MPKVHKKILEMLAGGPVPFTELDKKFHLTPIRTCSRKGWLINMIRPNGIAYVSLTGTGLEALKGALKK